MLQFSLENQCQNTVRSMKILYRLNTRKYRSLVKEIKIPLILHAMSKIPDPVFIFIMMEEFTSAGIGVLLTDNTLRSSYLLTSHE
jgi:hypothetical protein